jgi:hypothetical protein
MSMDLNILSRLCCRHNLILFERAAEGDCDGPICDRTHVPFGWQIEMTLRVTAGTGLKDQIQIGPGMISV